RREPFEARQNTESPPEKAQPRAEETEVARGVPRMRPGSAKSGRRSALSPPGSRLSAPESRLSAPGTPKWVPGARNGSPEAEMALRRSRNEGPGTALTCPRYSARPVPAPTTRSVLQTLPRARLAELGQVFAVAVPAGATRDQQADALASAAILE